MVCVDLVSFVIGGLMGSRLIWIGVILNRLVFSLFGVCRFVKVDLIVVIGFVLRLV